MSFVVATMRRGRHAPSAAGFIALLRDMERYLTCQLLMAPSQGFAVVVVCNRGDPKTWRSTGELAWQLARHYGL